MKQAKIAAYEREALCMSLRQFGRLTGVCHQAVTALERSEAKGNTRLQTLRKAAKHLQCDFVYALAPNKSVEKFLRDCTFVNLLPKMVLGFGDINALIDTKKMLDNPHLLWDEPPMQKEYLDMIVSRGREYHKRKRERVAKKKKAAAPIDRIPIEEEATELIAEIRELAGVGKEGV